MARVTAMIASGILQHVITVRRLGAGDDEMDLTLNLVPSCLHTESPVQISNAHCMI